METNRRALIGATAALAGSAALNAAAIVAAKADAEADPVFDLIRRHRALRAHIEATSYTYSEEAQGEGPELDDDVDRLNEISDAIMAAPFKTVGGAAAALRYIAEFEVSEFSNSQPVIEFMNNVASALDRIEVQS